MSPADDFSLARLRDRAQIEDILLRWCRAVDRLDTSSIERLFHSDATDRHGAFNGGVDGLIQWITDRHKSISFSMHQLSNVLVEFAGPNLALVESTVCSIQRYAPDAGEALAQSSGGKLGEPGAETDVFGSARYVDRFERRAGEWRIAARTVVFGWKRMAAVPADGPRIPPEYEAQRRDAADFIFRARQALGIQ